MPPAPLFPTRRYFPPGIRKVYWLLTTTNYLLPTRAELNAGTDLSGEVSTMTGWSLIANQVDVPDMGSRFISQVPGRLVSATNEIEFFLDQGGDDIRRLFTLGLNGFIVPLWEGDVSGQFMDVFPVRVASIAPDTTIEDPGKVSVAFAATKIPALQVVIP